ncbi:unnamed protein product [Parajaminaea phylloscopi]
MAGCFSFLAGRKTLDAASQASSVTLADGGAVVGAKGDLKGQTTPPLVRSQATTHTGDRLAALRKRMEQSDIDIYIVPSEDPHGSEYTAPRDQLRAFISGFTGSAGTVIVGREKAYLWADGRYHVQAEQQLDDNWTLLKLGLDGVPSWNDWITSNVFEELGKSTIRFGVDSTRIPYKTVAGILQQGSLNPDTHLEGVFEEKSLVADVWEHDFPDLYPPPADVAVREHPLRFAGEEASVKLGKLVRWLDGVSAEKLLPGQEGPRTNVATGMQDGKKGRGSHYVVDTLDEVTWLLNLRAIPPGIPNNPVFPAYVIVAKADDEAQSGHASVGATYQATLFADLDLFPDGSEVRRYVSDSLGLRIAAYSDVWAALKALPGDDKVVTSASASYAVVQAISPERTSTLEPSLSPLGLWKACKNPVEVQGMRNAYRRDGIAWAKWAAWLEEQVAAKKRKVSEYDAALALEYQRRHLPNYAGFEAYEAISGTGENAALPHYETPKKGSAIIDTKTPFIMDSGGQYFDGTIDITRTVHFGKPTADQKRYFTRVLQGHIAIDSAVFPAGKTTGATLDAFARRPLWTEHADFLHGTGHGIGAFANVHELFVVFSSSAASGKQPTSALPTFRVGMTLSNEPGYYRIDGGNGFGIRTESIVAVEEVPKQPGWLRFERLTRVPISTKLVQWDLLTREEAKWLKEHNELCWRDLKEDLKHDKRALRWLKRQ